jgi:nitrous oxide reductase accessory protein NosL
MVSAGEMKNTVFALLTFLLFGCNREERPEAPTPAEAERLDEAEAMLNSLANEEGPASMPADPSVNSQ